MTISTDVGTGYRAEHLALVDELREKLRLAALGGPESARERHVSRGKLLPRDRVISLLDQGSPFLEIAPLAANGMYDDEAPARASSPASAGCRAANASSSPTTRPSRAAPTTR